LLKGDSTQVISLKEGALKRTKQHFSLLVYVWALSAASLANSWLGRWNEALEEGQEALRVAEEFSDNSLISYAAWNISYAYIFKGDLDRAIEHGEMAVEAAPTPADKAWAQMALAYAWIMAGELNKGIEILEAILPLSKGFIPSDLAILAELGEGYLLCGEYDKARRTLDELLEIAERYGARFHLGWGYRLLGVLALKTNPKKAAHHFEECIAITQEIKAENELAHAYAGYGRYFRLQGNLAQAHEYLTKALEIFERLGNMIEPDKVRKELTELPDD
jgi:tetratricopeptide (TPR) repeat protein